MQYRRKDGRRKVIDYDDPLPNREAVFWVYSDRWRGCLKVGLKDLRSILAIIPQDPVCILYFPHNPVC